MNYHLFSTTLAGKERNGADRTPTASSPASFTALKAIQEWSG